MLWSIFKIHQRSGPPHISFKRSFLNLESHSRPCLIENCRVDRFYPPHFPPFSDKYPQYSMYQTDCPMNVFGCFPSILNVKFSCGNPYLELQTLMRRLFTKLRLSFLLRRLPSADLILDQFSPIG